MVSVSRDSAMAVTDPNSLLGDKLTAFAPARAAVRAGT
jgi:hypothetical protein